MTALPLQAEEIERLHDALAALALRQSAMAPLSPAPGTRRSPIQTSNAGNSREPPAPQQVPQQAREQAQEAQHARRVQQTWQAQQHQQPTQEHQQQPKKAQQQQPDQAPQPLPPLPPFRLSHAVGTQLQLPSRHSVEPAAESESEEEEELGGGQGAAGGLSGGTWAVVSGSQPLTAPQAFFMPATGQPIYSGAAQGPVGQQHPLHSLAAAQHAWHGLGPAAARAPGALQGGRSPPPLTVTAAPPPWLLLRVAPAPVDSLTQPHTVVGASRPAALPRPHVTGLAEGQQQQRRRRRLQVG